jgi:hypothetical protein
LSLQFKRDRAEHTLRPRTWNARVRSGDFPEKVGANFLAAEGAQSALSRVEFVDAVSPESARKCRVRSHVQSAE